MLFDLSSEYGLLMLLIVFVDSVVEFVDFVTSPMRVVPNKTFRVIEVLVFQKLLGLGVAGVR